jgi:hypothetical protein
LLKTESCAHVGKPVWCYGPGGLHEFDDPWMRLSNLWRYVKPCWRHFWEHGRPSDAMHASLPVVTQPVLGFGMRASRPLLSTSVSLDRIEERWPQILEEFRLVADLAHVETCVWGRALSSADHETILGCDCPTCRGMCQTVLDTFWEHGAWRPSSARACVSLMVDIWQPVWVLDEASRPLLSTSYNRSNLLDRNIRRVAANLEDLLRPNLAHVETGVWGVPSAWRDLHEVRRSFDDRPTCGRYVKRAGDTFGNMGAWRDRHLRMRVSLPVEPPLGFL